MTYIHPQDIVRRLLRRGIHSVPSNSTAEVIGEDGKWGKVIIDLVYRELCWRAYIKDKHAIKTVLQHTLLNFDDEVWEYNKLEFIRNQP